MHLPVLSLAIVAGDVLLVGVIESGLQVPATCIDCACELRCTQS